MTTGGETGVWAPEAITALNRAYAAACDILQAEQVDYEARVKLAEHMMYLARNGEVDADRLCSLSVIAVLGRKPAARPTTAATRA